MLNFDEMESLSTWIMQHGSMALFVLLACGIIALPVPEETLMVIAGVLMYNEKIAIYPTLISTYGGSICGITVSYLLGRTAGHYIIHKYGSLIGFTQDRIDKVHRWFERFGTWVLFVGYFIPGIRHFTGFSAGTTDLSFKRFALFAYTGAVVWVSTFLSLGYFFGNYWTSIFEKIEIDIDTIAFFGLLILIALVIFKLKR